MAANIRTIGLSGLARILVQHDRPGDAEAENLARMVIAANSNFIERPIASGSSGTRDGAESASATTGLPLLDLSAADAAQLPGDAPDPKRVQGAGYHLFSARQWSRRGSPGRTSMAPGNPGAARGAICAGYRLQGSRGHFPGDARLRIGRIIMRRRSAIELAEQARREGVRDLRQAGLLKVEQGLTSLEEVMAVTNE